MKNNHVYKLLALLKRLTQFPIVTYLIVRETRNEVFFLYYIRGTREYSFLLYYFKRRVYAWAILKFK